MKVGIKEISEKTGFSIATVSNVLNNKKNTNKTTAQTILLAAKELGYKTSSHIKKIRLVRYKKYGTVLDDTPFFGALIEGIQRGCEKNEYILEMVTVNHNSRNDLEKLELLALDHTTAILLLATEMQEEDMLPFKEAYAPIVILDSWFPSMKYSAVTINNIDSAANAVLHLLEHGHTKIGYLKSSTEINNFKERSEGFFKAFREKEIPFLQEFCVKLSPTTEGSYTDMLHFLESNPTLPTAFFADNDIIALGALKALQEKGISVPGDISLIGFDDIPYATLSSPTLTTVDVFKEELGEAAVDMVHSIIENPSGAKNRLEISTRFIERESVKDFM